jgi:hypothetical protein
MATREQMLAARDRRMVRFNTRLEWFGERVMRNVNIGIIARLKATGQLLRDKVVINISIPVVKRKSKRTGRIVVIERSKPGEFPRADTTRLMKDIFWEVDEREMRGRVGTTLDYGLELELHMRRSFLRRTLNELAPQIGLIIASAGGGPAGPLPGQDA